MDDMQACDVQMSCLQTGYPEKFHSEDAVECAGGDADATDPQITIAGNKAPRMDV